MGGRHVHGLTAAAVWLMRVLYVNVPRVSIVTSVPIFSAKGHGQRRSQEFDLGGYKC